MVQYSKKFSKVLRLWFCLREYCEECEKNDFPLQLDRTHYLHEYSLLYRVPASRGVVHISPGTQMFNEEMEKYRNEDLVPLSQVPSEGF